MVATKLINIGLKSPMDFTMGVSKGFHNAPKLYGDDSVRELPRVTGFQSGLKAAGKVHLFFGVIVSSPIAYADTGIWLRPL